MTGKTNIIDMGLNPNISTTNALNMLNQSVLVRTISKPSYEPMGKSLTAAVTELHKTLISSGGG